MSRENGIKFNIHILFKCGTELEFESYSFNTTRDRAGELTALEWDLVDTSKQMLYIRLSDISFIFTSEIEEEE